MTPRARRTDPWTSWAAAHSIEGLRARQVAVLVVLGRLSLGATLEELVLRYRASAAIGVVPPQSDSGIRTRCAELADAGHVVDTGRTRPTAAGRAARVLAVAVPAAAAS